MQIKQEGCDRKGIWHRTCCRRCGDHVPGASKRANNNILSEGRSLPSPCTATSQTRVSWFNSWIIWEKIFKQDSVLDGNFSKVVKKHFIFWQKISQDGNWMDSNDKTCLLSGLRHRYTAPKQFDESWPCTLERDSVVVGLLNQCESILSFIIVYEVQDDFFGLRGYFWGDSLFSIDIICTQVV